ncbi:MAG: hypothetical protein AAGA99_27185 [Actinomycetota bacterium]
MRALGGFVMVGVMAVVAAPAALATESVSTAAEVAGSAEVDGYLLVDATGVVHAVGDAVSFGGEQPVRGASGEQAVSIDARPDGEGYTVAFSDGAFGAGGAATLGDIDGLLAVGETVAAARLTPDLLGIWMATSLGRVHVNGSAPFHGDLDGLPLVAPIIDLVPTTTGNGYWLVAADGGVFSFGDARFHGSMGGQPLNAPVVDLVPDPDGQGYWLIAADGGVFAFEAPFRGSLPGVLGDRQLNAPISAAVQAPGGYVMVGADGGVFVFADDAPFVGSLADDPPEAPIADIVPTFAIDRWMVSGTVIDEGDGPRVCFAVLTSLPPQCGGGPRLLDFDWDAIDGEERSGDVTWVSGVRLVVTTTGSAPAEEVRFLGEASASAFVPGDSAALVPMCETPAGGWQPDDPTRVSRVRFDAAIAAARALDGHASAAVARIVPLGEFPEDEEAQQRWLDLAEDITNDIVAIRHVGDPAPVVDAVRAHWGGPVCVLPADFSDAEGQDAASRVPLDPNVLGLGIGSWFDGLQLSIAFADGAATEGLDRTLAPGMLTTFVWMRPLA